MRKAVLLACFLAAVASGFLRASVKAAPATATPAAPQQEVPKGEVLKFTFENSAIFPGTWREYWVYIPRQYDPVKPACVYVNQDGVQWQAPQVFDQLIARQEMPVTIGVFVMHGRVKAPHDRALDRFNRSLEYDGMGDNYARFLLEELLPDVEKKTASDGRAIRLSRSGSDRAIGGSSSGAVCAFTAAWERPDAFARVFSAIGTYVGLRGANEYPTLVRKMEPKPIRVFLQGGSRDLNIYAGDWWMVNQEMQRALSFAGYEVNHVWGEGGHDGRHGTEVFPDAMRWLWKDWPKPISSGGGPSQLRDILIPGEGWNLVAESERFNNGLAVNAQGDIMFDDVASSRLYRMPPGFKYVRFEGNGPAVQGPVFGPGGRTFSLDGDKVVAHSPQFVRGVIAGGIKGRDLVVRSDGAIFVTAAGAAAGTSDIWHVSPQGRKKVVDTAPAFLESVTLSPDQTLLYVADPRSHWVYSYQALPDGTLKHRQRFYHLHVPDSADDSGAGGMAVDDAGRLYVATRMGVQVCDQAGRVNCIIPVPGGAVSDIVIAGSAFDNLFARTGNKLYRRKVKVKAAPAFLPPVKPEPPRL